MRHSSTAVCVHTARIGAPARALYAIVSALRGSVCAPASGEPPRCIRAAQIRWFGVAGPAAYGVDGTSGRCSREDGVRHRAPFCDHTARIGAPARALYAIVSALRGSARPRAVCHRDVSALSGYAAHSWGGGRPYILRGRRNPGTVSSREDRPQLLVLEHGGLRLSSALSGSRCPRAWCAPSRRIRAARICRAILGWPALDPAAVTEPADIELERRSAAAGCPRARRLCFRTARLACARVHCALRDVSALRG